ncbi:MAG: anthranilate synthase component I family protein, partial [Thermoanaerobaculia bacterium]
MTRLMTRTLLADTTTPVAVMRKLLAGGSESFLLESVEGGRNVARYSFLGTSPKARIEFRDGGVSVEGGGSQRAAGAGEHPLEIVNRLTVRPGFQREEGQPPFSAGAVGYLTYDAVRLFERVPARHPRTSAMPDALFLLFESTIAFDHAKGVMLLQTLHEESEAGGAASSRLDTLQSLVEGPVPAEERPALAPPEFSEQTSRESFLRSVDSAKRRIAEGDIYQIQISRRWAGRLETDPFEVYRALRRVNPSPYQFFLRTRQADILGASPEMLVRTRGRRIETRPIAGTYPRGETPAEDRDLEERFLSDPKERAEHVMLVDLARNDLGRVCETGSVRVPEFFRVEKYSHVQHLVSSVEGLLRPEVTSLEALAASFPAGTLTGAPKIRAMEIIDELETARRGIYGG